MEVDPEPDIVSDRMKLFLDDPQWPKHIKDPPHKQIKRHTLQTYNFVNCSCSSILFEIF